MKSLHDNNVRLAPWMGCVPPLVEDRVHLEHAMDHARAWLRHGKRLMQDWRLERMGPALLRRQAA